jgi:hypothetical protein
MMAGTRMLFMRNERALRQDVEHSQQKVHMRYEAVQQIRLKAAWGK